MNRSCGLHRDGLARHGDLIHAIGAGERGRFGVPRVFLRHDADLGIDRVVPLDELAGVGAHAAQDGGHAALGAVLGFVVGLVIADGVEQVVVLLLIRIFGAFLFVAPGVVAADDMAADVAIALRAHDVLGNIAPTAIDVAALAEAARAIGVFELDGVVVEDFAVIRAFAHFAAAHAMRADGIALLDPVDDIEVVNVLLADMVAAKPDEVIPVAHLVLHLGELSAGLSFQL